MSAIFVRVARRSKGAERERKNMEYSMNGPFISIGQPGHEQTWDGQGGGMMMLPDAPGIYSEDGTAFGSQTMLPPQVMVPTVFDGATKGEERLEGLSGPTYSHARTNKVDAKHIFVSATLAGPKNGVPFASQWSEGMAMFAIDNPDSDVKPFPRANVVSNMPSLIVNWAQLRFLCQQGKQKMDSHIEWRIPAHCDRMAKARIGLAEPAKKELTICDILKLREEEWYQMDKKEKDPAYAALTAEVMKEENQVILWNNLGHLKARVKFLGYLNKFQPGQDGQSIKCDIAVRNNMKVHNYWDHTIENNDRLGGILKRAAPDSPYTIVPWISHSRRTPTRKELRFTTNCNGMKFIEYGIFFPMGICVGLDPDPVDPNEQESMDQVDSAAKAMRGDLMMSDNTMFDALEESTRVAKTSLPYVAMSIGPWGVGAIAADLGSFYAWIDKKRRAAPAPEAEKSGGEKEKASGAPDNYTSYLAYELAGGNPGAANAIMEWLTKAAMPNEARSTAETFRKYMTAVANQYTAKDDARKSAKIWEGIMAAVIDTTAIDIAGHGSKAIAFNCTTPAESNAREALACIMAFAPAKHFTALPFLQMAKYMITPGVETKFWKKLGENTQKGTMTDAARLEYGAALFLQLDRGGYVAWLTSIDVTKVANLTPFIDIGGLSNEDKTKYEKINADGIVAWKAKVLAMWKGEAAPAQAGGAPAAPPEGETKTVATTYDDSGDEGDFDMLTTGGSDAAAAAGKRQ